MTHYITIDGTPYCEVEYHFFGIHRPGRAGIPYPACCGHQSRESAEAAVGRVRNALTNLLDLPHNVQVVEGVCPSYEYDYDDSSDLE